MDENTQIFLSVLGTERKSIPYRKELNNVTGGVVPTLVLQQFLYYFQNSEFKPFYKFVVPCKVNKKGEINKLYREGDSWTEELGISKYQFSESFKKLKKLGIVYKKRNSSNVTYYHVNYDKLVELLKIVYLKTEEGTAPTEPKKKKKKKKSKKKSKFPFHVEQFGEDEASSVKGKPTLNQVRHKAVEMRDKKLMSEETAILVGTAFWNKQEGLGWAKLKKYDNFLKNYMNVWLRNLEGKKKEEEKKETKVFKPLTLEEMKLFLKQMNEDDRKKIRFSVRDKDKNTHPVYFNHVGLPYFAETLGEVSAGNYVGDVTRDAIYSELLKIFKKKGRL